MTEQPNEPGAGEGAAHEPHGQLSRSEIIKGITDLAAHEPQTFQAMVQNFWQAGEEEGGGTIQLPPEIVEQSLRNEEARSQREHKLRMAVVVSLGVGVLLLLLFILALVYLLRDHVDFTKEILTVLTLLITHGAIGGGAYYAGKGQGKKTRRRAK